MNTYKQIFDLNKDWGQDEIVVEIISRDLGVYRHHEAGPTAPQPIADCLRDATAALSRRFPKASRVVVLLHDEVEWDARFGNLE